MSANMHSTLADIVCLLTHVDLREMLSPLHLCINCFGTLGFWYTVWYTHTHISHRIGDIMTKLLGISENMYSLWKSFEYDLTHSRLYILKVFIYYILCSFIYY